MTAPTKELPTHGKTSRRGFHALEKAEGTTKDTKHTKRELPEGWRWVKLGEVCAINPSRPAALSRADSEPTSFVPMDAVDAVSGGISRPLLRPFGEIKKGYTCFVEGDVLFAKITPCMQNGKHAIARDLTDGIGFGTTEFHVLRPAESVLSEWVHFFVRQPEFLNKATEQFTGAVGQQRLPPGYLEAHPIPLPPLAEQKRIAARLREQMAAVEKARAATQARLESAHALPAAIAAEASRRGAKQRYVLGDCLVEVRNGVGADWSKYPVLGATRSGLAPAKEAVGKAPERYKLVDPVTVFYNPMRILLGSIAMVDDGDAAGITSPDYVVVKGRPGVLDTRWFYYWFRSTHGAHLIESLSRGAVRERILFNRLATADIEIPDYDTQRRASAQMQKVRPIVNSIEEELRAVDAMPAAILRRVFSGAA